MQKVEMYIPVFPEMRGMPDPKTSFTQVARNDSHFVLSFRACKLSYFAKFAFIIAT